MPRAARLIADRLAAAGCRYAFGIPGGEVLTLMQALDEAGIRFHLCKHENAGGFMAEGTWHATGAPGVLLATLGPGLANTVNVAANALQDQVPLIILSGHVDAADAVSYTHQVIDQAAVMRPVCKASFTGVDGGIDAAIDRAVTLAQADPPGPVHVDVPVRLAASEQPPARPATPRPARGAPVPGESLTAARTRLARARRPVMLAGMGAVQHAAGGRIRAVCERFGMPLVTTYKAKGIIPESHPLCLGGHGLSPLSDSYVLALIAQADLVLTVGYDPIEMRAGWRDPWPPARAIELLHAEAGHAVHGAALRFVGDVEAGLSALTDGVESAATPWPDGEPQTVRRDLAAAFAARSGRGPDAMLDAARRALPRDAIATADSGAHRILMSQMWRCEAPGQLLQSSAFCTMGCAVPLAIGYKLARPDTPVLAVTGDAGLEMVLGEIATVRELGLSIPILVFVDGSLALIERKQRAGDAPQLGVTFGASDFPRIAEAMGGVGRRITEGADLADEIRAALARDRFTILACEIAARDYDQRF